MKANRCLALAVLIATIGWTTGSVRADYVFGKPQNLGPAVNSSSQEMSPSISADGLSLYFASDRVGGLGEYDLWVSTRPTTDAAWGPAVNLGPRVNSQYAEMDPSISFDGLSLYFSDSHSGMGFGRPRPGGFATGDGGNIWVVTRATINDPWSAPVNLGPALNSSQYDQVVHPNISADGLSLYVHACDKGIGVAQRASTAEPFGTPELLKFPGSHGANDWWPNISPDERTLFISVWGGTSIGFQLWVTWRPIADSDFGLPTTLPASINVPGSWAFCPNLAADGSALYFCSTQRGGLGRDLWQVPIIPTVDFNGDEIVDIKDLVILIENWGQSDPSVDIGPMPWGDGVVDAADLKVLMRYWQQEVLPVSLLAYWKLDEAEGIVAADSAGANHGTLIGNPLWQPTGGKLGGALQLDGVDDCVTTEFIRDPSEGGFSVFAWVKGGAPGQVILSHAGGANWLIADATSGALITELKAARRSGKAATSAKSITDGVWHRVGLVWAGADCILYVDDVEVARGAQSALPNSTGGLYLGASSTLAPGTYWSGLIDDVRVYDRAVTP